MDVHDDITGRCAVVHDLVTITCWARVAGMEGFLATCLCKRSTVPVRATFFDTSEAAGATDAHACDTIFLEGWVMAVQMGTADWVMTSADLAGTPFRGQAASRIGMCPVKDCPSVGLNNLPL